MHVFLILKASRSIASAKYTGACLICQDVSIVQVEADYGAMKFTHLTISRTFFTFKNTSKGIVAWNSDEQKGEMLSLHPGYKENQTLISSGLTEISILPYVFI